MWPFNRKKRKARRAALAVEEPTLQVAVVDGEGVVEQDLDVEALAGEHLTMVLPSVEVPAAVAGEAPTAVLDQAAEFAVATLVESPPEPLPVPCNCAHSGRLTFGPPAVLEASHRRFPEQPMVVPGTVSDTVLDGMEDEHLAVRAVSVRGHAHRYRGEVRQDSMSFRSTGDAILCVVADGVSSGKHSQLGSATAALEAARWPEFATPWDTSSGTIDVGLFAAWLDMSMSSPLISRAEVATTMALAHIPTEPSSDEDGRPEWVVTLLNVGDSGFRAIRGGHIECDEHHSEGFAHSGTKALPINTTAEVSQIVMREGDVLLVASDGVLNIMELQADYREAIAGLWEFGDPEPAELLRVVDATVKSFSDDRTLVGIRFKEVAGDYA